MQEANKIYKTLYSSKINYADYNELNERFLDDHLINKITEEQKLLCEGNITIDEIKSTLMEMKHDKSPGIDGIPIEVYKVLWNDLGH